MSSFCNGYISVDGTCLSNYTHLLWELCEDLVFVKLCASGPLAQLAEHLTFNQGVTGSRPVRPTKANRPTLPGNFQTNQGVKTLSLPTP